MPALALLLTTFLTFFAYISHQNFDLLFSILYSISFIVTCTLYYNSKSLLSAFTLKQQHRRIISTSAFMLSLLICYTTLPDIDFLRQNNYSLEYTLRFLHIVFAFFSLGLFIALTLQATHTLHIHYQLKAKKIPSTQHSINSNYTSMEYLEHRLSTLIHHTLGFCILSSVFSFFIYQNLLSQKLSHKAFFTALSCIMLIYIAVQRKQKKWHIIKTSKYCIVATSLIWLGFFGSKIILHLLAHP